MANDAYLMRDGSIQWERPSKDGRDKRLPPGSSMHMESQTSPRTFANDVNTSAKRTSEKYTGLSIEENIHLAALLLGIITAHIIKASTVIRTG